MIKSKHSFPGFTLIEVMIAMVLSLIFLGGFLQILSINSQSFRIRDSLSRLQEDGRLAIELMSRELRHTGYRVYPYTDGTLVDSSTPVDADHRLFKAIDNAFAAADDVPADAPIFGLTAAPDSIIIRYQIDNIADLAASLCGGSISPGLTDAQYEAAGVNAVVTEKFFVDNNELKCDARLDHYTDTNVAAAITTVNANALPLVSNVENLRILYGIDTGSDNIPNSYVDASNVTDWQKVNAVKITIILRTDKTNLSNSNTSSPITINGGFDVAISSVTDRRLYRIFSTTIMLRNMALW